MAASKNVVVEEKIDVVAEYHKHNKETIEVISHRDPVTKAIYYKRVSTDPNAAIFAKKFIKKGRLKNESSKSPKPKKETKDPNPKSDKVEKPKNMAEPKEKKIPLPRASGYFRKNTMVETAYNLWKKGLTAQEIADKMGKDKKSIQSMIYDRRLALGTLPPKKDYITPIKKMFLEGKTAREIGTALDLKERNVQFYITKIEKLKSPEEIACENDEILEAIKKQMKKYKTDYCYSHWINKANFTLKSMLHSIARINRCLQLTEEGKLIIDESGRSRKFGTMYRLP